jgi:membrane protease YdiL (CAAX protease family)
MEKIKKIIFERPVLFSILLLVVAISLTEIPLDKALPTIVDAQSTNYIAGAFEQFLVSWLLFLLIKWLGLLDYAGFNSPRHWKSVWLVWPILVLTVLNGSGLLDGSLVLDTSKPIHIILFTLLYISVGLFEEILCRGLVLLLFVQKWGSTQKGIYLSVLISSGLFALGHIVNLLQHRYSPLADFTQIFFGLFFGVFFAACFLRNQTIWTAILTHTIFDMAGSLQDISVGGTFHAYRAISVQDALVSIAITLPLFLYGLWILRKVEPVLIQTKPALPVIDVPGTGIVNKFDRREKDGIGY